MAKFVYTSLTNLTNESSAVTTINNNFAALQTLLEQMLSRDGTIPNTMDADLDMNSNDILNVLTLSATGNITTTADLSADDLTLTGTFTFDGTTYANASDLEGECGADGTDGDDGSLIYVQASAPSVSNPNLSLWIDSDSTDIDLFQLTGGTWSDTGVNLKGGKGDKGDQGDPGDMDTSVYDPASVSEQLVGLTATQTLMNKTLGATTVSGTITFDADQTYNIGSASNGANNIYCHEMHVDWFFRVGDGDRAGFVHNNADQYIQFSGGSSSGAGGGFTVWGQSHASRASDCAWRSSAIEVWTWDDSANDHIFRNKSNQPILTLDGDNQQVKIGGYASNATVPATVNIETPGTAVEEFGLIISNPKNGNGDAIGLSFKSELNNPPDAGKCALMFERKSGWGVGNLHVCINDDNTVDTAAALADKKITFERYGNLCIGGDSRPASGVACLAIFNGTAPTGSVTNGVVLYSEDVSASAELKVRDEAGNVTTLSPHNFDLIPSGPSEEMAWAYYSERNGRKINVDMLALAREVEKISGSKLVYEE